MFLTALDVHNSDRINDLKINGVHRAPLFCSIFQPGALSGVSLPRDSINPRFLPLPGPSLALELSNNLPRPLIGFFQCFSGYFHDTTY